MITFTDDGKKAMDYSLKESKKLMTAANVVKYLELHHPISSSHTGTKETNYIYYFWSPDGYWKSISYGHIRYWISRALRGYQITSNYVSEIINTLLLQRCEMMQDPIQSPPNGVIIFTKSFSIFLKQNGTWESKAAVKENYNKLALQIDFDPNKNYKEPEAFLKWLQWFTKNDNDMILFLQEMFGYCLTPNFLKAKVFYLYGAGRNGKSTLLYGVLEKIIGRRNAACLSATEIDKQTARVLEETLVNISAENDTGKPNYSLLKKLSQGEPVPLNEKYAAPRQMIPTAKLIFALNELPPVTELTFAWKSRLRIIPCDQTLDPEKEDVFLCQKFTKELVQIAAWAFEGLIRLIKNGGEFAPCKRITIETENYLQNASSVLVFWNDEILKESRKIIDDYILETQNFEKTTQKDAVNVFPIIDFQYGLIHIQLTYSYIKSGYYISARDAFNLYSAYCYSVGFKPKMKKNFLHETEKVTDILETRDRTYGNGWLIQAAFKKPLKFEI